MNNKILNVQLMWCQKQQANAWPIQHNDWTGWYKSMAGRESAESARTNSRQKFVLFEPQFVEMGDDKQAATLFRELTRSRICMIANAASEKNKGEKQVRNLPLGSTGDG